ncbi:hypothetical protein [Burkholderia vietnamiensis]|uniref:hypothetical protein n=1 Tax=Burkholderia vietnamiensis TaxID=60552 RepID=UPI002012F6FB|nr:hypothetical protein [Burkholderia vietnamiensis]
MGDQRRVGRRRLERERHRPRAQRVDQPSRHRHGARAPALAHHLQAPGVVERAVERGACERTGGRRGELDAAQPGRIGKQQQERVARLRCPIRGLLA